MVLLISRPIIFLFFLISLLSGPDTESLDMLHFRGFPSLLFAFKRAGFANQSIDEYKLLPCSLGTFVNAFSKDPKCLECPAGNFLNSCDMRVTYFLIIQITLLEASVLRSFFLLLNMYLQ